MYEQQLEFNIEEKSDLEIKFSYLEKHISEVSKSLDKTRRSLFARLADLQKSVIFLKAENNDLKRKLYENDSPSFDATSYSWTYCENDCLFDIKTG